MNRLQKMMTSQRQAIHLALNGLPAYKAGAVREYGDDLKGKLTLHFLLGYEPNLNPNELLWRYAERTGLVSRPLAIGEKFAERVRVQMADIKARSGLVHSFFEHPSVTYIIDA